MASDDSASGESRQVRELAPELRETAREAARRRGISVDQWLRSAIVDSAKEGGGATSKEGGGAASAEPAAAQDLFSRRLDALSEQLDRLSRVGVSPSAAPAASAPDPELKDSLHAIERRLAALGQNVPPSAVATPSLVEVLARLNSRLDRIVGARPAGSPARNSDMAPEGEDVSDGLLTDDWDTDLDRAITEINTRQRALLGEIDVSAFEAALAEPDPEAVAAAARPPGAGITQLQQQFEKLTEELRILRVSGGFADRIETLRSEVAGIAATLQNAAPRVAIENLESQVRALVERVDRTRIAGGESETLTDVERALRDLRETIERMAPAELLAGLRDQASVLDRKIEQAGARGQDDGSTLPQLQKQVSELREIVGRAATGDGLVTLTQEVRSLAARLDRFDPRQAEEDLLARLDRKFDALTVGLAAGGGKSADDLVRLVDTLSRKIDALEINRNNLPALENIVDQVTRLSERIEASGTRLDQLGEIESSFARLLDRMDELHGQTIETAERVARETVSSRPGADADTLARALRRIDELNTTQRENERHTQDTLEAVHDTLERLVDRMAGLEGGGVRA
ncbi:MAG: hypothetical protein J0H62_00910, partial [Rhizobiales bacterium]|nr:hypothetical protein [Hyphomicrobiales bacterium]